MKNIYTYLAIFLVVLLSSCGTSKDFAQSYAPESQDITYQQFYDGLSPYGDWVDYPNYGYVWIPNEQNFRPYYNNGHWVYTSYGWTWVSGYNWGWAPFHYGRWLYDDAYGWMWTPGYEWAPAWVSWRDGSDCYGWAPLGPGMNFGANMGSRIPDNNWAFVPRRYINSPRINNYYINREKNVTIINNTTVINNTNVTNNKTVYVTGPAPAEVEKVTNQKVRPVRIIQQKTPGNTQVSGSTVSIYRPVVRELPQQNGQAKPPRIVNLSELRNRQNQGVIQNQNPGTDSRPTTLPADTRIHPTADPNVQQNNATNRPSEINKQPEVNNQQPPVINNQQTPVINKQQPVINKQPEVNNQQPPVINKQPAVINKQPEINNQQPPVINKQPAVINKQPEVNNQQPPVINKQPAVINQQPHINNQPPVITQQPPAKQPQVTNQQPPVINTPRAKVRATNQANSQGNPRGNTSSAPVNRQPVKTQQNNVERPQRVAPNYRPANTAPVNHAPAIRNQVPAESRENVRETPQKVRQ